MNVVVVQRQCLTCRSGRNEGECCSCLKDSALPVVGVDMKVNVLVPVVVVDMEVKYSILQLVDRKS